MSSPVNESGGLRAPFRRSAPDGKKAGWPHSGSGICTGRSCAALVGKGHEPAALLASELAPRLALRESFRQGCPYKSPMTCWIVAPA